MPSRVITLGPRYKSYDIMLLLFKYLKLPYNVRVLDLTYGKGRFYRKIINNYRPYIIGVDIEKHEWEVAPSEFHQMDMRQFNANVDVDVVVVDAPWSHEKRGVAPKYTGISNMPYHMKGVSSIELTEHAIAIAKKLGVPLIYKYKEPIPNSCLVVINTIVYMMHRSSIYYGVICNPKSI